MQVHWTSAAINEIGIDNIVASQSPPTLFVPYIGGVPVAKDADSLLHAALGPDFFVLSEARRDHRDRTWGDQVQNGLFYFYAICRRARSRLSIRPGESLPASEAHLEVETETGWRQVLIPDYEHPYPEATVSLTPSRLLQLTRGDDISTMPHWLFADYAFIDPRTRPTELDLEILYIGKSQGTERSSSALVRLESHSKYQRILEDHASEALRHYELFVLLGSGSGMNLVGASRDGEPMTAEQQVKETHRIRSGFDRRSRVNVTESILINYFKPPYNVHFVDSTPVQFTEVRRLARLGVKTFHVALGTEAPCWHFFKTEATSRLVVHNAFVATG